MILGTGRSRAQSDIQVALEKARGRNLSTTENLARKGFRTAFVDEGGRSRTAGKADYLNLLAQQSKADKKLYDLAGRGEAILQEGLARKTRSMESANISDLGMMPNFGSAVMDPGPDRQGQAMSAISTGLSIAAMFAGSDRKLKENIEQVGTSPKGHKIYEWNYISTPNTRYRGVIAQDVVKINPMAVDVLDNGKLAVFYDMIDVNMEIVS